MRVGKLKARRADRFDQAELDWGRASEESCKIPRGPRPAAVALQHTVTDSVSHYTDCLIACCLESGYKIISNTAVVTASTHTKNSAGSPVTMMRPTKSEQHEREMRNDAFSQDHDVPPMSLLLFV